MKRLAACLLAGVLFFQCLPPALAGGPPTKYIALSFDDGPSGAITELLLDGLAARNVPATFFVCAYRVRQYPVTLCRIAAEGHEIGLHSCCHTYMDKMSKDDIQADLIECRTAVTECCGVSPRLFRPPGGLYSPALLEASKDEGLSVILWSIDPEDWNSAKSSKVYSRILQHAQPGAIILMHDLSKASVQSALRAVDALQSQGYTFCTVSELADCYDTALEPGGVYNNFPSR